MLDPMDFKELDRVALAMQQWFVSQGFEDRKEQIVIIARLAARHIFNATNSMVKDVPKMTSLEDVEKLSFKDALTGAAIVTYYDRQAEIIANFIKADLAELSGWKFKKVGS